MFSLGVADHAGLLGCVLWVVRHFTRDHNAFIFKDQQMKTVQSPHMLHTTHSVTLHHMSEDFSPLLIFSLSLIPSTIHDTDLHVISVLITCFLKIHLTLFVPCSYVHSKFFRVPVIPLLLSVHLLVWIIAINTQFMKFGIGEFKFVVPWLFWLKWISSNGQFVWDRMCLCCLYDLYSHITVHVCNSKKVSK